MRPETNLITDVSKLLTSSSELKGRQFIGSNQIVFGTYEMAGVYDWGGELTYPSQTPTQKGRGLLVTATGREGSNLIADLAVIMSKDPSMSPEYTYANYFYDAFGGGSNPLSLSINGVALPTTQSHKKRWQLFMIGNNGQYAYIKNQVIANDDVTIDVVVNY